MSPKLAAVMVNGGHLIPVICVSACAADLEEVESERLYSADRVRPRFRLQRLDAAIHAGASAFEELWHTRRDVPGLDAEFRRPLPGVGLQVAQLIGQHDSASDLVRLGAGFRLDGP